MLALASPPHLPTSAVHSSPRAMIHPLCFPPLNFTTLPSTLAHMFPATRLEANREEAEAGDGLTLQVLTGR